MQWAGRRGSATSIAGTLIILTLFIPAVLQKRFCGKSEQLAKLAEIDYFNPGVSRMNWICPRTSSFGSHLTWPFRIMCTAS